MADFLQAKPGGQFLRIAAVFLVAGIVCLWLARQITAPVRRLSEAARQYLPLETFSISGNGDDGGNQ